MTLPDYPSDFLFTVLVVTAIGLLLLVPATFWGGKVGVIVAIALLMLGSWFLYAWGTGLGRSFANAPPVVNAGLDWSMLLVMLKLLLFYSFLAYGVWHLCQTIKTDEKSYVVLSLWFAVLIGLPASLYGHQTYQLYVKQIKHYATSIIVTHAKTMPLIIDQLTFIDLSNDERLIVSLRLDNTENIAERFEALAPEALAINTEDSSGSNVSAQQNYYTHYQDIYVPAGFDQFELSWYSILEQRFYKDSFAVVRKKLSIKRDFTGQTKMSDLIINIWPQGHVDLLKQEQGERTHLNQYRDVAYKEIKLEQKLLADVFGTNHQKSRLISQISQAKQQFEQTDNNQDSLNEQLKLRQFYDWGLTVNVLNETEHSYQVKAITVADVFLRSYSRRVTGLKVTEQQPLPNRLVFELSDNNDKEIKLQLVLDPMVLQALVQRGMKDGEGEFQLEVNIDINSLDSSEVFIIEAGRRVRLNARAQRRN